MSAVGLAEVSLEVYRFIGPLILGLHGISRSARKLIWIFTIIKEKKKGAARNGTGPNLHKLCDINYI